MVAAVTPPRSVGAVVKSTLLFAVPRFAPVKLPLESAPFVRLAKVSAFVPVLVMLNVLPPRWISNAPAVSTEAPALPM